MTSERAAVTKSFESMAAAKEASAVLTEAGFSSERISIIGKGCPPKFPGAEYQRLLRAGRYVLILYGSPAELSRASDMLAPTPGRR